MRENPTEIIGIKFARNEKNNLADKMQIQVLRATGHWNFNVLGLQH
jgi:hypothetical protein